MPEDVLFLIAWLIALTCLGVQVKRDSPSDQSVESVLAITMKLLTTVALAMITPFAALALITINLKSFHAMHTLIYLVLALGPIAWYFGLQMISHESKPKLSVILKNNSNWIICGWVPTLLVSYLIMVYTDVMIFFN